MAFVFALVGRPRVCNLTKTTIRDCVCSVIATGFGVSTTMSRRYAARRDFRSRIFFRALYRYLGKGKNENKMHRSLCNARWRRRSVVEDSIRMCRQKCTQLRLIDRVGKIIAVWEAEVRVKPRAEIDGKGSINFIAQFNLESNILEIARLSIARLPELSHTSCRVMYIVVAPRARVFQHFKHIYHER